MQNKRLFKGTREGANLVVACIGGGRLDLVRRPRKAHTGPCVPLSNYTLPSLASHEKYHCHIAGRKERERGSFRPLVSKPRRDPMSAAAVRGVVCFPQGLQVPKTTIQRTEKDNTAATWSLPFPYSSLFGHVLRVMVDSAVSIVPQPWLPRWQLTLRWCFRSPSPGCAHCISVFARRRRRCGGCWLNVDSGVLGSRLMDSEHLQSYRIVLLSRGASANTKKKRRSGTVRHCWRELKASRELIYINISYTKVTRSLPR